MGLAKTNQKNIKKQNINSSFNNNLQIIKLKSLSEITLITEDGLKNHEWTQSEYGSNKFMFGKEFPSLEKTTSAINKGQSSNETLKLVTKLSSQLKPIISGLAPNGHSIKRKRRFGEEGANLDIDRLLCGDPYHWTKMSTNRTPPLVKLWVNIAMNAGMSSSCFQKASALVITMAKQLEQMGFSTEINAVACSNVQTIKDRHDFVMVMPIKKASEKLDVNRVSTIGLDGIFRYFTFSMRENLVHDGMGDGGHGSSQGVSDKVKKELGIKDGMLVNAKDFGRRDYFEQSKKQLKSLLKDAGIK